jgi:c(7)-type cytochrome triheme protein
MSDSAPRQKQQTDIALRRNRRVVALLVMLAGIVGVTVAFATDLHSAGSDSTEPVQGAAPRDFSRFSHTTSAHTRLPCKVCHMRGGASGENAATPNIRPGHRPCSSCHAQQFAQNKGPLCAICHTTQEPKSAELKPFAKLASFTIKFDHAPHTNAGCAKCHSATNRGSALSVPSGDTAHSTCFQCHGPGATKDGRDLSSCDVCHQRGRPQRISQTTRAYKVGFSHAAHGARQKLSCNDCHRATGAQALRARITEPEPLMHHASAQSQSCASCHNNQRAFGTDNFADCKRCHKGSGFRF